MQAIDLGSNDFLRAQSSRNHLLVNLKLKTPGEAKDVPQACDCNGGASIRPFVMAAISDLSLADVLHQAPKLFDVLQQHRLLDLLLATNTGMCHLVQQYVTHITIPDQSHIHTFAQNRWPSLQGMSLQSVQDPSAIAGLSQGDWQILRLQPTFGKLDLDAIMNLQRNIWPWQMLTDLEVYFGQGLPVDLHMLSTCHWPLLQSLTLRSGRLDDAQAAVIFRADWPFLSSLRLPYNCLMHLEGVDHNRWPQLKSLCLMDNPVSNTGLHRLVSAQWPQRQYNPRVDTTCMASFDRGKLANAIYFGSSWEQDTGNYDEGHC